MVFGSRLFISIGIPSTKTSGSLLPNVETPRILTAAASPPGSPLSCETEIPVTPPCKACEREVIGLLTTLAATFTWEMDEIEFNLRSSERPVTTTSFNRLTSSSIEIIRLLSRRFTVYSVVLKPMNEKTNTSPFSTWILKYPSISVVTPIAFPFTCTLTPTIGIGLEVFS